jgi:hypothetical protein
VPDITITYPPNRIQNAAAKVWPKREVINRVGRVSRGILSGIEESASPTVWSGGVGIASNHCCQTKVAPKHYECNG